MICVTNVQGAVERRLPVSKFNPDIYTPEIKTGMFVSMHSNEFTEQVANIQLEELVTDVTTEGYTTTFTKSGEVVVLYPTSDFMKHPDNVELFYKDSKQAATAKRQLLRKALNKRTVNSLSVKLDTASETDKLILAGLQAFDGIITKSSTELSSATVDRIIINAEQIAEIAEAEKSTLDTAAKKVLLHELVHGNSIATFHIANKGNKQAIEKVQGIMELWKDFKEANASNPFMSSTVDVNALEASPEEFLAVAISDSSLQAYLNNLDSGWWERSLEATAELFDAVLPTNTDKLIELYKRLVTFDSTIPNRRDLVLAKFGYGKGSEQYYDIENKEVMKIIGDVLRRSDKVQTQYKDGKELDYYLIDAVKYMRLTTPDGFVNKLVTKKSRHIEDVIKILIEREWKYSKATDKLPLGENGELYTQEEFADSVRTNVSKSQYRGRIIHMLIEQAVSNKAGLALDTDFEDRLRNERDAYSNVETIRAKQNFAWVQDAVDSYLESAGISIGDDIIKGCKVATEVGIYSEVLNFASRIDLLTVRNFDGKVGIVDTKTGHDVLDNTLKDMLNEYAYQTSYIHGNARDKAKFEIMLRAFALKVTYPALKFYMLKIGNFQNAEYAARKSHVDNVEVYDYLEMMKGMFKNKTLTDKAGLTNPNDKQTLYDKIIKQSPQAFDATHYFDNTLITEANRPDSATTDEKVIQRDMASLTDMVANQVLSGNKHWNAKIAALTEDILKTYNVTTEQWDKNYEDLSMIRRWLGNFEDWDLPAARAYARMYHEHLREYEAEAGAFKTRLQNVSEKLLSEHNKRLGKLGIKWATNIKYYVGDARKTGLYDFAYKVEIRDGRNMYRLINRANDPEKFTNGELTKTQIEYLDLVNSAMSEAGDYLQEKRYTVKVKKRGETNDVSKSSLDMWNDAQELYEYPKRREIKSGFFWKFPKTEGEIITDNFHKGGAGKVLKQLFHNTLMNFTWYNEVYYDADKVNAAMIPIKGLGSAGNDSMGNFTFDLTFSTLQGHNNYLRKKHMDDVAIVGAGLQHLLDSMETPEGDFKAYKGALDDKVHRAVLGIMRQSKINNSPIYMRFKDHKGDTYRMPLSVDKLVKGLMRFVNTAIMPLRFFQPLGTGVQALLSLSRDIAANSLLRTIDKNAKELYTNYNISDLGSSLVETFKVGKAVVFGDERVNKAYLIARNIGYLPKSYTAFVERDTLATSNLAAFSQANMYAMQAFTENPITYLTLITQLKAIKYGDKSLWDMYNIKNGELVYTGGVRGYEKRNDGSTVPITELTSKEIAHMKFMYEKVQGGYSVSALAPVESYYLGQALMSLRRWLPRVMLNMWHDTRQSLHLGAYKPVKHNGEIVYMEDPKTKTRIPLMEWHAQMSEGKLTTLWRAALTLPAAFGRNSWTQRPIDFNNLKPHERQNLYEMLIATLMLISMLTAAALIWDEDDEKDYKDLSFEEKWFRRYLIENLAQQYNPVYLGDNVIKLGEVMAFKRTYDFGMYAAGFLHSVITHDVTRDGDYRYKKQFLKHLPYFGPIYSTARSLENSDLITIGQW